MLWRHMRPVAGLQTPLLRYSKPEAQSHMDSFPVWISIWTSCVFDTEIDEWACHVGTSPAILTMVRLLSDFVFCIVPCGICCLSLNYETLTWLHHARLLAMRWFWSACSTSHSVIANCIRHGSVLADNCQDCFDLKRYLDCESLSAQRNLFVLALDRERQIIDFYVWVLWPQILKLDAFCDSWFSKPDICFLLLTNHQIEFALYRYLLLYYIVQACLISSMRTIQETTFLKIKLNKQGLHVLGSTVYQAC